MTNDFEVELLKALRRSRLCIEDISGICRTPELILYKIFAGDEHPGDAACERIAAVLGVDPQTVFSHYEPEEDENS